MAATQSATQLPMIAPLFETSVYERRRKKLLSTLRPNIDLIVLFTQTLKTRSHDTEYDFRAHSSFLYYTGFPEPEAGMILRNVGKSTTYKEDYTLFVRPRDLVREHWNGRRIGPEGAKKFFKAGDSLPFGKLEEGILIALAKVPAGVSARIYTNAFHDPETEQFLFDVLRKHRAGIRRAEKSVEAVFDIEHVASAQRAIKGPEEIRMMRKASKINVEAHLEVLKKLKPGMYEYEVQAIVEGYYLSKGCRAPSYGSIVAAGDSATVLHYSENDKKLEAGKLLLIDAGCELEGYASDITRTWPISGKFSRAQRSLMDLVAEAHQEAIQLSVVGNTLQKIHENTERCMAEGLKALGVIKGSMKRIMDKQLHRKYFTHGTGHWLGLDVHDPNPYCDDKGEPVKLKPGMIFTVEPGVYFQPEDKSYSKSFSGIGIRIEDDVLITEGEPEILTEGLPRYAKEIETYIAES
jgi:Xaa-Pro aminopeptidase